MVRPEQRDSHSLVLLRKDPFLPVLEISTALHNICHEGAVKMFPAADGGKRQVEERCVREDKHPPYPVLAVEEVCMPT